MITQPLVDVLKRKKIQELVSVPPAATVAEAVSLMSRSGVGAVIVRKPDGAVEGIFTERDLMRRVVNEGREPKSTPVSSVMSAEVRRVTSSATVEEALRLMVEYGHRHVLVEDGKQAKGLVSVRDLMSWLILPDEPIAHEGRGGVIRARAEDALRTIQGS
jgi:CBS domain-containing protein